MKQTAVEWLENELKKLPLVNVIDVFEQAKEMEREQVASNCSQFEISDKEIKNIVDEIYPNANGSSKLLVSGFIQGCRWYREQLKQRQ